MMKTLFRYLSTVALALVLFVPAKTAQAGDFPAGVTFKQIVGKVVEPHAGDRVWSTLDNIEFGFMSRYVRICLQPQSARSYFRMNTTISTTVAAGIADTDLLLFPGDSSDIFINGTSGASFDYRAMPMRAAVSSDESTTGDATGYQQGPTCIVEPWATRGVIMHIVSGLATADVWGYR